MLQVILLAGDLGHSRAVHGESKAFVEVAGRPMVAHVLETLIRTPEISDIFIVGDIERLESTLAGSGLLELAAAHGSAVQLVPQRPTLYENVWEGFLRSLPAGEPDPDHEVLVVPSDIPLAIPAEISEFVAAARAADVDYALGLTADTALRPFAPRDGCPGIELACFNLAEGRFRQNNLHLVRPLRIRNRTYIQDMYESRYQMEIGSMVRVAWGILVREWRNLWVLFPYLILHLAGVCDRRGYARMAASLRRFVSLRTVERGIGDLLQTRFATVTTSFGGAALDVDNDPHLQVADKMLETWRSMQIERVRALS